MTTETRALGPTLAREIAPLIHDDRGPWTVETDLDETTDAVLSGPLGERLRLQVGADSGRVQVRGLDPLDVAGLAKAPLGRPSLWRIRIEAAVERGPRVLAREIARRLLPRYSPACAELREKVAAEAAIQAGARAMLASAAETLAPLGAVDVAPTEWVLNAGRYGDPLTARVELQRRTHNHWHKVAVDVAPGLLPALLRAIASVVAPEPERDPEVWSVLRYDQEDGLYLFESQHRAAQYAKPYGDAASPVRREFVMGDSTAAQFIIDSAGDDDLDDAEVPS